MVRMALKLAFFNRKMDSYSNDRDKLAISFYQVNFPHYSEFVMAAYLEGYKLAFCDSTEVRFNSTTRAT